MNRRRVMLLSDAPVYGGAERYLLELAKGLKRRFQVEAVTSWSGGANAFAADLERNGIPVRRLPPIMTLKDRVPLAKMMKHILVRRPHLLHFNLCDPRSCNGAMFAASLVTRRPFIVTEHLPHAPYDGKPLPFRHKVAARRTTVTIVNTAFGKQVVEQRPHNRSRVEVVVNGIEDPGAPTPERRAAARNALGFAEHQGPLGIWVGRMIPQKNPDLLVEGIRRVLPAVPDARFAVLGDGPEINTTQAKVRELGLDHAVRFYGHRNDARELIFGADLFISTSRFEGMPFTVLEAMFAGVPVVASAIPGTDDLVADGINGWLVPGEDGDALGNALRNALGDLSRLKGFGGIGRERAVTLFGAEMMCRHTADIYRSVLGS